MLRTSRIYLTAVSSVAMSLIACQGSIAGPVTLDKDQGPVNAKCDRFAGDQEAWRACVGSVQTASAEELFYAGYWLAKSGDFKRALTFLHSADQSDPRVVTYIGFATRKTGDVDAAMPYYAKALKLDPDYNVARAYLGEAYLSQGRLDAAEEQLSEIAQRCGVNCAEHVDLAGHIRSYKVAHRG